MKLETAIRKNLPSVPPTQLAELPSIPAIYYVLNARRVLYVGQTINLKNRFKIGHHRMFDFLANSFNEIAWQDLSSVPLDKLKKELYDREFDSIYELEPLLNIQIKNYARYKKEQMRQRLWLGG